MGGSLGVLGSQGGSHVGLWGSQSQKDGALEGGGHWGRMAEPRAEEAEGDSSVWGSCGWPD